jgi:hypothetical protein
MTNRALSVLIMILCPLGIAAWILAAFTIGESLSPPNCASIGFAVALLTVTLTGYLLAIGPRGVQGRTQLPLALVLCGTACILMAVILQFYLAYVAAENARRAADIKAESVKVGRDINNVNVNATVPASVPGVSYLALFAGVWLAALGIYLGTGREERPPAVVPDRLAPGPLALVETGVREVRPGP